MIRGLAYAFFVILLAAYFGCSPHNLLDEISGAGQRPLYRWVDEHGVVNYGPQLPPGQHATQNDETQSRSSSAGKIKK